MQLVFHPGTWLGHALAAATGGRSVPAGGLEQLPAPLTHIWRSTSTKETVFWLIPHSEPWPAPKCHREDWPRQGEVTTTKGQRQGRRSGISLSAALQGSRPSVLPTLFVLHSRKKCGAGGWCGSSDVAWNSSGVSRAPLALPPASQQGKLSAEKKKPRLIKEIIIITLQWYLGLTCGMSFTVRDFKALLGKCCWAPVAGGETEARGFGPCWR